jgi:hypothetical protein
MKMVPTTINVTETSFVFCVKNDDYPVSLELRKVYQVVQDDWAAAHGHIRIIDESGEDYLYPVEFFVPLALPEAAEGVFARVA